MLTGKANSIDTVVFHKTIRAKINLALPGSI
jgi:hypothetical protein